MQGAFIPWQGAPIDVPCPYSGWAVHCVLCHPHCSALLRCHEPLAQTNHQDGCPMTRSNHQVKQSFWHLHVSCCACTAPFLVMQYHTAMHSRTEIVTSPDHRGPPLPPTSAMNASPAPAMTRTTLTSLLAFCQFLEPACTADDDRLLSSEKDRHRCASKIPPFLYVLDVPKPPRTSPFVVPNMA